MKRLIALLRDYFGVSQQEAKGLMALLILTAFLLSFPFFYSRWAPDLVTDTRVSDQRLLDSLVALIGDRTEEKTDFAVVNRSTPNKVTTRNPLFQFNPNKLDVTGWQQLGLPVWLASRIERYRLKGGQFRKKEDLLRIYNFPPDLYGRLEPYIILDENSTSRSTNMTQFDKQKALRKEELLASKSILAERFRRPPMQPFDINAADTSLLISLKGIGSKLAGRIVKFRDALGGFVSSQQFGEIFGLDSLARRELERFARIETPARKIAINTATVEELDRHVYLTARQAHVIVNYRNQHGPFTSPESLRAIRVLDVKTIERLTPYLEF